MNDAIEWSLIRDYRRAGAPPGYWVVQTPRYYAWWDLHQPEVVQVHDPDGRQVAWLTLRLSGAIETDGPAPVAGPSRPVNLEELNAPGNGGRAWAGGRRAGRTVTVVFRGGDYEHRVTFHADRIQYVMRAALAGPTRLRRCLMGAGTTLRADCVFNAGPASPGLYHHPPQQPQLIRPDWFTPPPYCFAFRMADGSWLTAALEAPVGQMSFQRFGTRPEAGHGLGFVVSYDSEPPVSGVFVSPPLVFRFGATDEFAALRQHAAGMVADSVIAPVSRPLADWWRGVMFCGWHWQMTEGPKRGQAGGDSCTQALYEEMVAALEAAGIAFDILTIDMFWGRQQGLWEVDPVKWPDLRGFIDRQHAAGRRVLLWVSTGVDGLPQDEVYRAGNTTLLDPLHPRWQRRVAESCARMFGSGLGQYHADGIKFDFTDVVPPAGEHRGTRELHGLDYLHALFTTVHDAAKAARPDVLLDFQVAHPAFAGLYDMTRLNDFFLPSRQAVRVMRTRAQIAHAVGFGALVDVDGPVSADYFRESPTFGNPSLYLAPDHLTDPQLRPALAQLARLARTYRRGNGSASCGDNMK